MKNTKKGFTLIELLVVIAIIGILSAVVLASLNTARAKGQDAAIKSNLNNSRAQAALFYDTTNNYTNVCSTATTGIGQFKTGATNAGSGTVNCNSDANNWFMEAQLRTDTTKYYCVDSTGAAVTNNVAKGTAATAC